MRAPVAIVCVAAAFAVAGCFARPHVGWFDDDAFYAARQHLRVRYVAGAEPQRALMSPGWRLESFQTDEAGRPGPAKRGPSYEMTRQLDLDDDGRVDRHARDWRWDLHFDHVSDEAEVWVRSSPVSRSVAQRPLSAFSRDLVQAFVTDDAPSKFERPRLRLEARIVEEGEATFGTVGAYRMIFEVHDLDRAETDPSRVGAVVYFVLARPSWRWDPGGGRGDASDPEMVVLFGYAARPSTFGAHRAAFEDLLDRVDFRPDDER